MKPTGTITVDTHRGSVAWDRRILGQFIEHFHRQIYGGIFEPGSLLSDSSGFRFDVIEALRDLRVPVVRWPGGCFVSAYHWLDGVGPRRSPAFDKAWQVEDPNTFGTDEFMAWCLRIGAEPYICTNAGTGTPEEMSDWVEYCNQRLGKWARLRAANGNPDPYAVRHWSIGNENYGAWEIGAKTAAEWGRFVVEAAKMMRQADPGITLYAAAINDSDWMIELLRRAGDKLDMVSVHAYYDSLGGKDLPSDYPTCMLRCTQPEADIVRTEHLLAALGRERIGIAFDEWNLRGWHHPLGDIAARDRNDLNTTYTMADAIFSSSFLNACLRHARTVRMANMAPLVNTRGPLFVHPGGIVKRTTFHVLWMYANLLAERVADTWVESTPFRHGDASVPAIDAVVTHDAGLCSWRCILVNRDPDQEATCQLRVGGVSVPDRLSATILSGDHPDAFNDIARPHRVVPQRAELDATDGAVRLPPHSLTVLEWQR